MVKVYAQLIKKGFKTIDDVPEKLREKVAEEVSLMQVGDQEEVTEDSQDKVDNGASENPQEDEDKVEEGVTEDPQNKVEDEPPLVDEEFSVGATEEVPKGDPLVQE